MWKIWSPRSLKSQEFGALSTLLLVDGVVKEISTISLGVVKQNSKFGSVLWLTSKRMVEKDHFKCQWEYKMTISVGWCCRRADQCDTLVVIHWPGLDIGTSTQWQSRTQKLPPLRKWIFSKHIFLQSQQCISLQSSCIMPKHKEAKNSSRRQKSTTQKQQHPGGSILNQEPCHQIHHLGIAFFGWSVEFSHGTEEIFKITWWWT